jgi:hypothetical protein
LNYLALALTLTSTLTLYGCTAKERVDSRTGERFKNLQPKRNPIIVLEIDTYSLNTLLHIFAVPY